MGTKLVHIVPNDDAFQFKVKGQRCTDNIGDFFPLKDAKCLNAYIKQTLYDACHHSRDTAVFVPFSFVQCFFNTAVSIVLPERIFGFVQLRLLKSPPHTHTHIFKDEKNNLTWLSDFIVTDEKTL